MSCARLLALAPIGVTIVAYLLMVVIAIAKRDISILGGAYFFAAWAIVIGYAYVIVIWVGLKVAQRFQWVRASEPT